MKILSSQVGNQIIMDNIISKKPFIATKLGAVEQNIVIAKLNNNFESIRHMASNNAGITPSDNETLEFFFNEYTKSISNSDMIGSMSLSQEKYIIDKYNPEATFCELRYLEPFYHENPWSKCLENLNVLVIHPFEDTIINQYKKRENLFINKKILPDFNLLTIKAEQTNGGGRNGNKTFTESLELMKEKIDKLNFDIALIGCGAYGLLLANHVKTNKKQAIHIGGGLQILFGIKGKRWDVHPEISAMYNDFWVRPLDNEKTINIDLVEGGTYW